MTKAQALSEARKRWGKSAAVQVGRRGPSSPEMREQAKKEYDWLSNKKGKTKGEVKTMRLARSMSHYQRYDVGYVGAACGFGMFFVEGSGDSFDEAFQKAKESDERISKSKAERKKKGARA